MSRRRVYRFVRDDRAESRNTKNSRSTTGGFVFSGQTGSELSTFDFRPALGYLAPVATETASESSASKKKKNGKLALYLIGILLAAAGGSLFGYAATRWIDIPKVELLEKYRPDVVTEVRARDGTVIGRFAIERRIVLAPDKIPPIVKNAILSIEDHRFYKHGGIDPVRLFQAGLHDIRTGSKAQGASTLTQQLAKMLFLTPEKTFRRKVNEMLFAFEIERRFSKDYIFALYANQVYLGHGNYGIEAAARDYFGKPSAALDPEEAALLAALIQRPEYFNPTHHPERARKRRDLVLHQMSEEGYLSAKDAQSAIGRPIVIPGPAGRDAEIGSHYTEEVRQEIEKNYGEKGLYRAGLRVDTTLDPYLERVAEHAIRSGVRNLGKKSGWRGPIRNVVKPDPKSDEKSVKPELAILPEWTDFRPADGVFVPAVVISADKKGAKLKVGAHDYALQMSTLAWTWKKDASFLKPGDVVETSFHALPTGTFELSLESPQVCEAALVAIENRTGAIRALVGGEQFTTSKFDRATQAMRQAGSAFKPFVYLTALEKGMTGADTIFDAPVTITAEKGLPPYTPHNYYKRNYGIQTLQRALELSHNVCAVKLLMLLGPNEVIERARRLGVVADFKPYPSMALGAFEVDLLHMTAAYSVFPSQGIYQKPYSIERITDADGRLLDEHPSDPKEVVTPQVAYQMVSLLRGVVDRGTAMSARSLKLDMGGKTGTTDDYSDAWFVGFTPAMTVGVWVGHDTKKTLGKGMTGAKAALPIWMEFAEAMKQQNPALQSLEFEVPSGIVFTPVDLATGLRATPSCHLISLIPTPAGAEPGQECNERWNQIATLPPSLQRTFYQPKPGEIMTVASYIEGAQGSGTGDEEADEPEGPTH